MAQKSVDNLLVGIEARKNNLFESAFGLGIRHVGETVAKRLVNHFGSIDTLANASHEDAFAAEDIGEKIVESI